MQRRDQAPFNCWRPWKERTSDFGNKEKHADAEDDAEARRVLHEHSVVGTDLGQVENVGAGQIALIGVEGRVGAGGDVGAGGALGAG